MYKQMHEKSDIRAHMETKHTLGSTLNDSWQI